MKTSLGRAFLWYLNKALLNFHIESSWIGGTVLSTIQARSESRCFAKNLVEHQEFTTASRFLEMNIAKKTSCGQERASKSWFLLMVVIIRNFRSECLQSCKKSRRNSLQMFLRKRFEDRCYPSSKTILKHMLVLYLMSWVSWKAKAQYLSAHRLFETWEKWFRNPNPCVQQSTW